MKFTSATDRPAQAASALTQRDGTGGEARVGNEGGARTAVLGFVGRIVRFFKGPSTTPEHEQLRSAERLLPSAQSNPPLVFHELGHNSSQAVTTDSPPSIELFLQDGLKSQTVLRVEGRLPEKENLYEKSLQRREQWRNERTQALRHNPDILRNVLCSDTESTWVTGHDIFYRSEFPGNREENIFFGYAEHPSSDRDWVAIEVPETATLHDASCRDRGVPNEWLQTAVPIAQFKQMQARGELPPRWQSGYNEHLVRDRVLPEKIIAYAKTEKELPIEQRRMTGEELTWLQNFISHKLGFATQFEDPKDNVSIHERDGKY